MNTKEKMLLIEIEDMRYVLNQFKNHVECMECTLDIIFECLSQPTEKEINNWIKNKYK